MTFLRTRPPRTRLPKLLTSPVTMTMPLSGGRAPGQSAVPLSSSSSRRRAVGGNLGWRSGNVGFSGARTWFVAAHAALPAVLLVGFGPAGCRSFALPPPNVGGALLVPAFGGGDKGAAAGGAAASRGAAYRLEVVGKHELDRAARGVEVRGCASGRRKSCRLQVEESAWGVM